MQNVLQIEKINAIQEFAADVGVLLKSAQMCKDEFLSPENYLWFWNEIEKLTQEYIGENKDD